MHFKFYPWEFFTETHLAQLDKVAASFIQLPDPYCENFLTDFLKSENDQIMTLMGSEITIEWIEDNLLSLSLFSMSESFLILNCEKFSPAIIKFLVENISRIEQKKVYFLFQKTSKIVNLMKKKESAMTHEILAPKFWEWGKYIKFMTLQMGLQIEQAGIDYLVQALPNTPAIFFQKLLLLKMIPRQSKSLLRVVEIKSHIINEKFDRFYLASLFSKKEFGVFFAQIEAQNNEYDFLREFFVFMQSHIFKLLNPHYTDEKSRLTSYDREILRDSTKWQSEDLKKWIRTFVSFEIDCKSKSWDFGHQIKNIYQFYKN